MLSTGDIHRVSLVFDGNYFPKVPYLIPPYLLSMRVRALTLTRDWAAERMLFAVRYDPLASWILTSVSTATAESAVSWTRVLRVSASR